VQATACGDGLAWSKVWCEEIVQQTEDAMLAVKPRERTSELRRGLISTSGLRVASVRLYFEPGGNRLICYAAFVSAFLAELKNLGVEKVEIDEVAGSSAGALLAAMLANEWSPDYMLKICDQAMRNGYRHMTLSEMIVLPYGLPVNLVPIMELWLASIQQEFGLELAPQPNLGIDAWNDTNNAPFRWCGNDYSMAQALASACAYRGIVMPVEARINGRPVRLVDGAHGPSPVQHQNAPNAVDLESTQDSQPV
jgi:predicted acylesterase/phospholipase RssA